MADYTCKRCEHTGPWDGDAFLYVSDPLDSNRGMYLCAKCAVAEWPSPVRFVFHIGTPEWVRERMATPKMLSRLRAWFGEHSPQGVEDFTVHYFHRREAESLRWLYKWDPQRSQKPCEPYSYRGWCNAGTRIVILVDETENADSIEWITYHELAHLSCSRAKMIDEAMDAENKVEGRTAYEWKDDGGHEADSEERLVNRVATAYMEGREYARPWWRPRVKALLAGEKELPDPHAPPTAVAEAVAEAVAPTEEKAAA